MVLGVFILAGALIFSGVSSENDSTQTEKSHTSVTTSETTASDGTEIVYNFRYEAYLEQHFEKHKEDTGCKTAEEYLLRANAVIENPRSLVGTEKPANEDDGGDTVYYLEETNEIVFVSEDGYIRTYFKPQRRMDYFEDNVVEVLDNAA